MFKAETRGAKVMAILGLKRSHTGVAAMRVEHSDDNGENSATPVADGC